MTCPLSVSLQEVLAYSPPSTSTARANPWPSSTPPSVNCGDRVLISVLLRILKDKCQSQAPWHLYGVGRETASRYIFVGTNLLGRCRVLSDHLRGRHDMVNIHDFPHWSGKKCGNMPIASCSLPPPPLLVALDRTGTRSTTRSSGSTSPRSRYGYRPCI